jgi:hypothetical protein
MEYAYLFGCLTQNVHCQLEQFTMKRMNKLSALVTGSMAIGLLLGASMVQAANVCREGDTVTEIKSLDVVTQQYDQVTIDVKFNVTTGFNIYGSSLDNMPFDFPYTEDDPYAVMLAINKALNEASPIPQSVGISSQQVFYIGADEERAEGITFIAAVGGEYLAGIWDPCSDFSDCVFGGTLLNPGFRYVYAELSLAGGNDCGNAPPQNPPDSVSITPGFSGSWFDETREGEGFNIEIGGSELAPYLLTYFYTYDANGNQMWLTGFASISGSDTVVVDMEVTSGTVWGDGFNPDDVNYADWGTITFQFSSCEAGTASYNSPEFGTGTFNLFHLTRISGLTCP